MDQLALARKEASERYKKREEQERFVREEQERVEREEIERLVREEIEKEREQQEREEIEKFFIEEWDRLANCSPIILEDLLDHLLSFETFTIEEERVTNLIEKLNKQQETTHPSAEDVRRMSTVMTQILGRTGVDVQIDLMDTSRDEELAQELSFFE